MSIKRILIIILISLAGIFVFRKAILREVTKNWEKETLIHETDDFKIEMAMNLSKGCAKRGIDFYGDTIMIYNLKLNDILLFLTQKNINSSEFSNSAKIPPKGFNFSYYPKDSAVNYKLNRTEILDKLSGEFNFKYHYDSVQIREYVSKLVDKEKLNKKKVGEKIGKFRLGKDYIEFMGKDLDGVFRAFNFYVNGQVFQNNIKDSQFYSFKIPSVKRDDILTYFDKELGIELNEKEIMTEIFILDFE